jgi:GNAT superfamily N-acetyltransferase
MASVRVAAVSDIEAIARVHISSWMTTYRNLMPDSVLDNLSFERRRDWWKSVIDEHSQQVFVAEENDQIIGFTYFGTERENDPVYRGELYAIYLLSDHQRKGWGRLLVKATAQGLLDLGISNMLVWVLSANPARRFYEKLGGNFLRDKPVEIGGAALQESAFGWNDIRLLAEMK